MFSSFSKFALKRRFSFSPLNSICRFDEDMLALQEMIRAFSKKKISPLADKIDKENEFPRDLWPQIGELGLLGITVPEEFGGSGMNYTAQCIAMEELSRASGTVGCSYVSHSNLCIGQIDKFGTKEQKAKYLPKLCSGEHVGALAMSEPNAGSDVVSMMTTATKKGSSYFINGTKLWITNASEADTMVKNHIFFNFQVVYAKTDSKAHQHGITAFILDTKTKGFSIAQKLDKLGMRGSPTCEVVFDNVEIPEENILGEVNRGVYVLMEGLNYERIILAAGPVGLMQHAFDISSEYCQTREQFNKKIGEFQLMQGKLADMYMKLQSSRAFLYSVAANADKGITSNAECAALQTFTAKNSVDLGLEAIQTLGGNGYTNEYPAGRILRDAKVYSIVGGTDEIRQWLTGREIMKHYKPFQ